MKAALAALALNRKHGGPPAGLLDGVAEHGPRGVGHVPQLGQGSHRLQSGGGHRVPLTDKASAGLAMGSARPDW